MAVRRLRAFTLVELLVVIAIIAILMSFSLPAIQAVREAAHRVKCLSNIRQVGLAILSYENSNGRFPPPGIVDDSGRTFQSRSGKMFSWVVLILPQLERDDLYARFDLKRSILEQEDNPQATVIPPLLCPSDEADGRYFADAELTDGKEFAKGNYAAYCSPFHVDLNPIYPGALAGRHGQKESDIVDGRSNTLMLAEVLTRDNVQDQRGVWALPWTGASLLAYDMHAIRRTPYKPWYRSEGFTQLPNNQGPVVDMLYACPDSAGAQLDQMPCAVYSDAWYSRNHFLSAASRSRHPGGVNVVFMGGRAGFLSDQVDQYAMAYMISIHDEEDLDVTEYVP